MVFPFYLMSLTKTKRHKNYFEGIDEKCICILSIPRSHYFTLLCYSHVVFKKDKINERCKSHINSMCQPQRTEEAILYVCASEESIVSSKTMFMIIKLIILHGANNGTRHLCIDRWGSN